MRNRLFFIMLALALMGAIDVRAETVLRKFEPTPREKVVELLKSWGFTWVKGPLGEEDFGSTV